MEQTQVPGCYTCGEPSWMAADRCGTPTPYCSIHYTIFARRHANCPQCWKGYKFADKPKQSRLRLSDRRRVNK